MKKLLITAVMLSLASGAACAGSQAKGGGVKFKPYAIEGGYFSCLVPSGWSLERDKDRDEDYKIYEIQLLGPKAGKAPTSIQVSFFAAGNSDFKDYQNFIERNSRNALGEQRNARESYAPVKETSVAGRKAFELASEVNEYLHPESKSDESVLIKEKIYVLPAKDGFYALRFSAPKPAFRANLAVFEKVAKSFKGRE